MKLLPEWRRVARWSWAFQLAIISALLSGAEVAMAILAPAYTSGRFAAAAGLVAASAAIARLLAQKHLSGRREDGNKPNT